MYSQYNIKNLTGPILTGIMLTASFPKIDLPYLAWISFVPLLYTIRNLPPPKSFKAGFAAGLVHYLTLMPWLVNTMETYGRLPIFLSIPVFFLLASYLSLYTGLFSILISKFLKKPGILIIAAPCMLVCLEYLRTFMFSGLPWGLVGYSQFRWLEIIQIADLFGVYGISFLIALSNIAIFLGILKITKKDWHGTIPGKKFLAGAVIFCIAAVFACVIYGKLRIETIESITDKSPFLRVSVIQGNVAQNIKWNNKFRESTTKKYINLSKKAGNLKPDLIVWPETAVPFYYLYNKELTELIQENIRDIKTNFLIGSPSFQVQNDKIVYFNSAFLIDSQGKKIGKYDKVHLVPFGEYVPFKKWLPFLGKIVEHVGDFKPGNKGNVLNLNNYKIGSQICFEIIFPKLARAMTQNNAQLLINLTNDAWFGRTGAPLQHFSMAVFRAVENRRSLVRSANTGISGFINPAGKIIQRSSILKTAVITDNVPLIDEKSFYTVYGDIFAGFCVVITLSLIIGYFFQLNSTVRRSAILFTIFPASPFII